MTKMLIDDDLVTVVRKKGGKTELLTVLAWGDEIELVENSTNTDPKSKEVMVEHYELQPDNSYKKQLVRGLIKKETKLRELSRPNVLKVSYVDVQQGDGMVIETPQGKVILVDGGDNKLFSRYLAERYCLHASKDDALPVEAILVTHGDADHFAGLTEIYKSQTNPTERKRLFLRPKRIFHNGIVKGPSTKNNKAVPVEKIFGETVKENNSTYLIDLVDDLRGVDSDRVNGPFKSWIAAIKAWDKNKCKDPNDNKDIVVKRLEFGADEEFQSFLAAEKIAVKVLGPLAVEVDHKKALPLLHDPPKTVPLEMADAVKNFDGKKYSASHTINGHSIVLQMKYNNVRFLFTGDLNEESEIVLQQKAANDGLDLRSEILKVPHHGSADFSHKFLELVSPVVSIISSGDESARKEYIHPRATLVGSLGKHSRLQRPLIFVTELVAFFEVMGYCKQLRKDGSKTTLPAKE